jgi:hypothetical protein
MDNTKDPRSPDADSNLLAFEPQLSPLQQLEADLSSLIDGELEADRLLEVIDHLLDEASAQRFYRRARALSGLVEATDSTVRSEPPVAVWRRISHAIDGNEAAESPDADSGPGHGDPWRAGSRPSLGGHLPRWASFVVAATLLVAALVAGWQLRREVTSPAEQGAGAIASITVGEGEMTDSRFVELATELLGAERRYRREIVDIIQSVEAELPTEMGSAEGSRRSEGVERSLDETDPDQSEGGGRRGNVNLRLF